jgi:hypothetical protein
MLDYLKYRIKLAKLRRQESRPSKIYQEAFKLYRIQKKSREDIERLDSERYSELKPIWEEIDFLVTSYLMAESKKHFIPFPDFESKNMWEECSFIGNVKVLSNLGIATVRSSLRNELREKIKLILQVLAGITGIVGALIGLFSIIKK